MLIYRIEVRSKGTVQSKWCPADSMSTLSGISAKGEKGGKKFQTLNINRLHLPAKGDNIEQSQTKNVLNHRNGMQVLGRLPQKRRPVNLPSEKSDPTASNNSLNLINRSGSGWVSGKTGENLPSSQVQLQQQQLPQQQLQQSVTTSTTNVPSTVTQTATAPPTLTSTQPRQVIHFEISILRITPLQQNYNIFYF